MYPPSVFLEIPIALCKSQYMYEVDSKSHKAIKAFCPLLDSSKSSTDCCTCLKTQRLAVAFHGQHNYSSKANLSKTKRIKSFNKGHVSYILPQLKKHL